MQEKIITLLTDFGLKDPYVAEMKAVMLTRCPGARIIDISHLIEKFDIRMGAFVLASAVSYFPRNTVHVAVVDPGVGTKRCPIIVETNFGYFVGPDNGLLMLAALKDLKCVYVIENSSFTFSKISQTFHGRDIFAPVAAHLAKGCHPSDFGKEIKDFAVPDFAEPYLEENFIKGEILYVDGFGNIITNISSELLQLSDFEDKKVKIKIGGVSTAVKFCYAYGDVSTGKGLAIIGGHDFLEFSVNQGNAAEFFKVKSGDEVCVWF